MGGKIKPIETLYRGYRFRSRLEARWAVFFDTAGIRWHYEPEGFDLSDVELPNQPGVLEKIELRTQNRTQDHGAQDKQETGMRYLPDFYLPRQECWVEIKGQEPTRREAELMLRLATATGQSTYIFYGELRAPKELQGKTSKHVVRTHFQSALGFHAIQDPQAPYIDRTWLEWHLEAFDLNIDPSTAKNLGPVVTGDYDYQWCECPQCGCLGITSYGDARFLKCACLVESPAQQARLSPFDPDAIFTDDASRLMAAYEEARGARFEHGERPHQDLLRSKLKLQSTLERIKKAIRDSDEAK